MADADHDIIGLTVIRDSAGDSNWVRMDAVYKSIQAPTQIDSIKKLSFSISLL